MDLPRRVRALRAAHPQGGAGRFDQGLPQVRARVMIYVCVYVCIFMDMCVCGPHMIHIYVRV